VSLRARAEHGFTIIEMLVALTVLVVGILGTYIAFASSQRLSLVSERHAAMTQMAQKEIEQIEGTEYSEVALNSTPSTSTDPTNPDYYVVGGSPPSYEWDRTATATEPLVIDTTSGAVTPVRTWTEGGFTGQIYDFVTWTQDSQCAPACPASEDYKRITVAVTMTSGLLPTPVYVSSIVSDPSAAPPGGCSGGSCGNPIVDPTTQCQNSSGQTVQCSQGIDQGNANTWFLHDCPATSSSCSTPTVNNATDATSGPIPALTCTTSQSAAGTAANVTGCPTPDLMDTTSPAGDTTTPLYNYSTDQCQTNCSGPAGTTTLCATGCTYPGGRLLQPTCSSGLCGGGPIGSGGSGPSGSGGGTDSTSDCTGGWSPSYLNTQSELWATAPLASSLSLTGYGGLTVFSQTLGGAPELVSFCVEIYDIPPSGSAGSLSDILAWPPQDLGGAALVQATSPSTGGNWPEAVNEVSFNFNFRGSNGAVTIPAGDRIGVRIWMKANVNTPIAVLYDNPNYPSQIQLNSQ
jgi:prepilin-type N-terminal cleavage/methylation domain-containing protein